jgi:hypothetical protein
MTQTTKQDLIQKLKDSRDKLHQVIQDADINKIIYHDGGWRARDIMLNIAYWEFEGAKSLNAFADNSEYVVPNFYERQNEINKETFLKFKDQDYSDLELYFDKGREELISALNRFSDNDLSKEVMAFYGGKTSIVEFIDVLIDHEQAHLADIVKANSN